MFVALVVIAGVVALSVLTVVRPQYDNGRSFEQIDLRKVRHSSLTEVRRAFLVQGIEFVAPATSRFPNATMTALGVERPPWLDDDLYVIVFGNTGSVTFDRDDWEPDVYEERVGNVLVHYGGTDEQMLESVRRAVVALRPARGRGYFPL